MIEPQLGKNIKVYIDDIVVKCKVESEHIGDLEHIFGILKIHQMWLNAFKCFLASALANFWVIWLPIVELKLTLIRLEQLTIYSVLGIPKRSRNWQEWLLLWIDSFLGQQTSAGLTFSCCISGRDLSGQRNVPQPSSNWRNIFLGHLLCPDLRRRRFYLLTSL